MEHRWSVRRAGGRILSLLDTACSHHAKRVQFLQSLNQAITHPEDGGFFMAHELALQYLRSHHDQYLTDLTEFLSIASISSLTQHQKDVRTAAQWLRDRLIRAGMPNAHLDETPGHPVVVGSLIVDPNRPTVLIYGHYDVQPVDPLEKWVHPPFEPTVIDDILYARGSSDDKGQVYMQLVALEAWLKTSGSLPVNVKVLFEGEEEIGSLHLSDYIKSHQEDLRADFAVISDTPMFAAEVPAICYGLRGLAAIEVSLTGPFQDLHSGVYGGTVMNPAHALAGLIASLHNADGTVNIKGFYDGVERLTEKEQQAFQALPFDSEAFLASTGSPMLFGDPHFTPLERIWAQPTVEVNGMWSGFIGEGRKTIVPAEAHAKITCRLVPNQDPHHVLDMVEAHLKAHCPTGVRLHIERGEGDPGTKTPLNHPSVLAAEQAIEDIYHQKAAYIRMGGSIPVVVTFQEVLNMPTLLLGFALPDENFHAPNEHFHLNNFYRGAETLALLWNYVGEKDALAFRGDNR